MTNVVIPKEDVMGFLHVIRKFLGVEQDDIRPALQDFKGELTLLRNSMEKSMSGVQNELQQTRQAFDTLKSAVTDRISALQASLTTALENHSDDLSTEGQAAFDGIQADMKALTDSLGSVTPTNPTPADLPDVDAEGTPVTQA